MPLKASGINVGVSLALQAYDQQGVDALFDIGNSAVSLAVQDIARQRGKILIHGDGGARCVVRKELLSDRRIVGL